MDYVLEPSRIAVNSPRSDLIPIRLFEQLGRTVKGHGQSFRWVLANLPQEESGIGSDYAHPRLIACLLRLGDLLDLDSGRFCPVLRSTFGKLPRRSEAHVKKHASIRRLLIGPDHIDVEAESPDMDSYEETAQWLRWLEEEIKEQAASWTFIAPPDFILFPRSGRSRHARLETISP